MNTKQQKKLITVLTLLMLLGMAMALVLYALKQNINLFYTPTQLTTANITSLQTIRVGGYVKDHSVQYDDSGKSVHFIITDHTHDIAVTFNGVLPSLFREGQGVVVAGKLSSPHDLSANQVLAKHDEKYMPWPLAKELKKENPHVS